MKGLEKERGRGGEGKGHLTQEHIITPVKYREIQA